MQPDPDPGPPIFFEILCGLLLGSHQRKTGTYNPNMEFFAGGVDAAAFEKKLEKTAAMHEAGEAGHAAFTSNFDAWLGAIHNLRQQGKDLENGG
jgi:hypothetical protein